VSAEELLEVQDSQVLALIQSQEFAQSSISLDGLLIHQTVTLGIGQDTLGDGRATDLSALRFTQEGAQLIRNLYRLGKDASADLGLTTLSGLYLALLAAIGLLDNTGSLLLNGLEGIGSSGGSSLQVSQLLMEISDGLLEGGTDVLLMDLSGCSNSRDSCYYRGDGSYRGSLVVLLGGSLGSSDNRGSSDYRCSGYGLGLGCGFLGRLNGGAHFDVVRGTIRRHGTRMVDRGQGTNELSTLVSGTPKVAGGA
jgi:hypothetical protein